MGPILVGSNKKHGLLSIWGISPVIVHCLGWCHIMTPVMSSTGDGGLALVFYSPREALILLGSCLAKRLRWGS